MQASWTNKTAGAEIFQYLVNVVADPNDITIEYKKE